MRLATLTMSGILAASGTVSTANAQIVPPPTPAAGQPAASPVAPPVISWPSDNLKLAEPMSRRLILNRGPSGSGGFLLERGGVTLLDNRYATGLDLAVAGSDRAVDLALEAHAKLVKGAVLSWTGLGLTLASAVALIAVDSVYLAQNNNSTNNNVSLPTGVAAAVGASLGGLLIGLVLEFVGIPYQTAGLKKECDAVNAYNSDLVDGLLKAR